MIRTIRATVRGGRLETETPIDLPEGTELDLSMAPLMQSDEAEMSKKEIQRILEIWDSLEPIRMTDEEIRQWECDLKRMNEADTIHLNQSVS